MIIFISDLDLRGSGYMNIAIALCNQLSERGRELYVLGMGYRGDEHPWPFAINPVETSKAFQHVHAMLSNLRSLSAAGQFPEIEAVVVALDIPLQQRVLQFPRGDIPYIGIFPIESGPLCPSWANILAPMDQRMVISRYGKQQIDDAGLASTYLPVGIDTDAWRMPSAKERKEMRDAMGFDEKDFVVLTVADNQERKNLSAAAEIIRGVSEKAPVKWQLVTRVDSKVGWALGDPPFDLGTTLTTYERGLSHDRLWTLYAISDAFLLTSKAEGLCMPIVEALSVGVPVAATECTAVPEHIYSGVARGWRAPRRGFGIPVEFVTIDPWGNSERSFVSIKKGVNVLTEIYQRGKRGKSLDKMIADGRVYAESRTWDQSGEILDKAIRDAVRAKKEAIRQREAAEKKGGEASKSKSKASAIPPTLPQPVPPMGGNEDEA